MIVGITDYVKPPFDIEGKAFDEDIEFIAFDSEDENTYDPDQLKRIDALLVWHAVVSRQTIQHLDNCKIVVRYGVGYDNVDIKTLQDLNIPFCNTPDYGTEEVADTACAMILNFQRKIQSYDIACRHYKSGWQEHVQPPLHRTSNQTLGIIGVGRIGTAVINRMKPFGYHIIGYDPYQPSGHEKAIGYERVYSHDELLGRADIISIHVPLTDETRGMINPEFLSKMKPGASIVNTARGKLVHDFDCIMESLQNNHLQSIVLDVLPEEPPPAHPLIEAWRTNEKWLDGRLVINPHAAYYSEQAWYEMRYKTAETAKLYIKDKILRNQIVC